MCVQIRSQVHLTNAKPWQAGMVTHEPATGRLFAEPTRPKRWQPLGTDNTFREPTHPYEILLNDTGMVRRRAASYAAAIMETAMS